jgi:hypothetical protein
MRFLRTVAQCKMSDPKNNEGIRDELEAINLLHKEGGLRVTISVCYSSEIELNIGTYLSIK